MKALYPSILNEYYTAPDDPYCPQAPINIKGITDGIKECIKCLEEEQKEIITKQLETVQKNVKG
jgi:hypothetical protein